MRKYYLFIALFILYHATSAQVEFVITSLPDNTPENSEIYIAGTFNGWNPGDVNYKLEKNDNNLYSINMSGTGSIEFKFTRGDWASVEGDAEGHYIPNRVYTFTNDTIAYFEILSWEDLGGSGQDSTAAANVHIIDEAFNMPQLDRTRRIWIYLPLDYETSDKSYPVLYMHDGQNLFENLTSFIGEWEVDESLNEFYLQNQNTPIVVGIDNGGNLRLDEYAPWYNTEYQAGGEGDAYVDFIVETLKPFIDSNYRTLSGRESTAIMGSSLGALISLYAGLKYPEVFSKIGLFSSAFWFNDSIFSYASGYNKIYNTKMYMIAGELEGSSILDGSQQMYNILLDNDFSTDEIVYNTHSDGQHSEWYWDREFIAAYQWMFSDYISSTEKLPGTNNEILVFPNPARDVIYFSKEIDEIEIYNLNGKKLMSKSCSVKSILVGNLNRGVYILKIKKNNSYRFQKLVLQ